MKFPSHIFLDALAPTSSLTRSYWNCSFLFYFFKNDYSWFNFSFLFYFLKNRPLVLNFLLINQKKFTLIYRKAKKINVNILNAVIKKKKKPSNRVKRKNPFLKFANVNVKIILKLIRTNLDISKNVLFFFKAFDVSFLKKEKIYTKLKYSRVPQYDIVSGGSAALFAGFLGFLICEKFGFELLDSGDFYILFMYLVFLFFFLKTALKLLSDKSFNWNILSFKFLVNYLKVLMFLFLNFIRKVFKK